MKIFITGGTIDDLEYEKIEVAPKEKDTLIPQLLKQSRITVNYHCEVLMMKDSKFVTDEDRKIILSKCQECTEEQIVITHGTMTMPETARFLGKRQLQKTIVLLGAAIPANKPKSDALFNLGTAIAAVQLLSPGVYITMNGKIFSWENVIKNMQKGYFEEESI